jgi:hypothetical protein
MLFESSILELRNYGEAGILSPPSPLHLLLTSKFAHFRKCSLQKQTLCPDEHLYKMF